MRPRVVVCPNLGCHKKIEEPILLNDLSVAPAEHYYACPYCFTKIYAHPYIRRNLRPTLTGLFLSVLGSAILAWVGWLTWYDVTVWGKDIPLIFFGSRTGELISLGIGMKVIYYCLIGLALLISGLGIFLRRRSKVVELRFSATAPEGKARATFFKVLFYPKVQQIFSLLPCKFFIVWPSSVKPKALTPLPRRRLLVVVLRFCSGRRQLHSL